MNKNQKESLGLLSAGTFLEYFDLMLYVHMAALLNELFFPSYNPSTAAIMTAFALFSPYLLRPIGAIIFGWLGDNYGRKTSVVVTTSLMAVSCIVMANLPTYKDIGILASYIVTACRMVQGISSMGEISGAQLYLSEAIDHPHKHPSVAFLAFSVALGTSAALGIASLVTSYGFNWRFAFWAGALIAIVGAAARTRLRETADFADAKKQIKRKIKHSQELLVKLDNNPTYIEKVNKKSLMALFFLNCMWPLCFYFSYIYCPYLLKKFHMYSPEQIIHQNFLVSMFQILNYLITTILCYRYHPFTIIRVKFFISAAILLIGPMFALYDDSVNKILVFQYFVIFFACDSAPLTSVIYKFFPIFKRLTCIGMTYAASRVFIYVLTSIYLTEFFSTLSLYLVIIPILVLFL